jgi:hypothetical protein
LVRSIFHLDGPNGHEVEWYATDCAKWPVKLDVGISCQGHWAPFFGADVQPDCQDEKMIAVNLRRQAQRAKGILLRLTPRDGGFDFLFVPGQLVSDPPGGEPKALDALCGTVTGTATELDGGWAVHTL